MSYLALRDMQDHGGFDENDALYLDSQGWIYRVRDGELVKCRPVSGCVCKASSEHGEGEVAE